MCITQCGKGSAALLFPHGQGNFVGKSERREYGEGKRSLGVTGGERAAARRNFERGSRPVRGTKSEQKIGKAPALLEPGKSRNFSVEAHIADIEGKRVDPCQAEGSESSSMVAASL